MTFEIHSTFYGYGYGDLVKAYPILNDLGARYVNSTTTHIFIESLAKLNYLREKLMENNNNIPAMYRVTGLIIGVDEDGKDTIEIYDGYRE